MPTEFITKRPHKKSREGCTTCKKRKIKCDEVQPKCSFCERRDLTCEYVSRTTRAPPKDRAQSPDQSPHSNSTDQDFLDFQEVSSALPTIIRTPSPAVPTKSGVLSQADLRAMHFWSLFTSQTLTGAHATGCLQITVPQLAFEHEYLLNILLGISSLHMQALTISSDKGQQEVTLYRTKAFAGFRKALASLNPSQTHDWESALIASILLNLLCARDYKVEEGDLVVLHWLTHYRGLASVINMRNFEDVMASKVAAIFQRSLNNIRIGPMVPYNLYNMLESISTSDPDYPHRMYYRKILDFLGVLYASLLQDGLTPAFATRVVAWCSLTGQNFTELAKEKRPRALILLAHYMVFVKCASGLIWWLENVSDEDIKRIFKMLPPKWFPFLEIPRQALEIEAPEDLRFWLLCSVDETLVPVFKTSIEDYEEAVTAFAPSVDMLDECVDDIDFVKPPVPYKYTRRAPNTKLQG